MNKASAVAFVYEVQADLARAGVSVRHYLPIVQAIYTPLREEFERELEEYTYRSSKKAEELVLKVNARGAIDEKALADIRAIVASRDAAVAEATRTLDVWRWSKYVDVLSLIKEAAICAYGHDAKGVGEVIRASGYGHHGMSIGPHVPWDEAVYAMLSRLYEIASVSELETKD